MYRHASGPTRMLCCVDSVTTSSPYSLWWLCIFFKLSTPLGKAMWLKKSQLVFSMLEMTRFMVAVSLVWWTWLKVGLENNLHTIL